MTAVRQGRPLGAVPDLRGIAQSLYPVMVIDFYCQNKSQKWLPPNWYKEKKFGNARKERDVKRETDVVWMRSGGLAGTAG